MSLSRAKVAHRTKLEKEYTKVVRYSSAGNLVAKWWPNIYRQSLLAGYVRRIRRSSTNFNSSKKPTRTGGKIWLFSLKRLKNVKQQRSAFCSLEQPETTLSTLEAPPKNLLCKILSHWRPVSQLICLRKNSVLSLTLLIFSMLCSSSSWLCPGCRSFETQRLLFLTA